MIPPAPRRCWPRPAIPNGFTTDLWAIPVARAYMPNGRRAGEMIQADWAKIGVTAKIVTYEWGEYLRRRARSASRTSRCTAAPGTTPTRAQMLVGLTCEQLTAGRNIPH